MTRDLTHILAGVNLDGLVVLMHVVEELRENLRLEPLVVGAGTVDRNVLPKVEQEALCKSGLRPWKKEVDFSADSLREATMVSVVGLLGASGLIRQTFGLEEEVDLVDRLAVVWVVAWAVVWVKPQVLEVLLHLVVGL